MTRFRQFRFVCWLTILFCMVSQSLTSATITAASASYADVLAAYNTSVIGDTILIPSGTVTWSSTLTIKKPVYVIGAGTNSTRIASSGTIMSVGLTNNAFTRISGIYFDLGTFSTSDHYAITVTANSYALRIDNCFFRGGEKTIWCQSPGYGVIDHCTFYNNNTAIAPWARNLNKGAGEWAKGFSIGTVNTLVVEDCHFIRDSGVSSFPNGEWLYGQEGAYCTLRYNNFTSTAMTAWDTWGVDAHGYFGAQYRGTHLYEIYKNTYNVDHTFRLMNLRGGTMIVYSNTVVGSVSMFAQLKNEGVSTYGVFNPTDELTNCFFWSNTVNGTLVGVSVESGSAPYVQQNVDYFLRAPQSGDVIYPYTPLTYPHPLLSGTLTVAPQNLRVAKGATIQFYATNNFGNGAPTNVTESAFWTSSIPAAASINRTNGSVVINANGEFFLSISAAWSNLTASTTLEVTNSTDYPPIPIRLTKIQSLSFDQHEIDLITSKPSVAVLQFSPLTNTGVILLSLTNAVVFYDASYLWQIYYDFYPELVNSNLRLILSDAAGNTNTTQWYLGGGSKGVVGTNFIPKTTMFAGGMLISN